MSSTLSHRNHRRGTRRGHSLVLAVLVVCASDLGFGAPSRISPDEARQRMQKVDEVIGRMRADLGPIADGYRVPLRREDGRLSRRLREAEVQSLIGDHYRAAIVLFDVVDRPEVRVHPDYRKAVFLMAESLRKAGHPRLARRYYKELASLTEGKRLGHVVIGLLEVASTTGDFEGVEVHIARWKAAADESVRPQVDLAYGKALFRGADKDLTRFSKALSLFQGVPQGKPESAPAAYYAGVTLVRMERYTEAIREFERTLDQAFAHPSSTETRELAYLSLGRLHQELGNTSAALDSYQGISKDSPFFADMLYEVAWAHVGAAEEAPDPKSQRSSFRRALDATELLMAAAPDSLLFPDARVLQGNLQIRLGAPENAYDTFQGIVDQFGGAKSELDALIASRKDARQFFDELIQADLQRLQQATLLPPMVMKFALDNRQIAKAVGVRRELLQTTEDLDEAQSLVRTLEEALASEQRFGMFPGLRQARLRALSVQNRMLSAHSELLTLERGIFVPYVNVVTLARLEVLRAQARRLERDISALPRTDQEIEKSRKQLESDYEKIAHRAFRMLSETRALRAQLVAANLWMVNQGVKLKPKERELTDDRMSRASIEIAALEEEIETVQMEVDRAALLSRGDGGWARAERLRKEINSAIEEQRKLLAPLRSQLPSELLGVTARIDQQREALRRLDSDLATLQIRLEQSVDARVDEVRKKVLDELRALRGFRAEQTELAGIADNLLGPVAEETMREVGTEFETLVLKADVGILDVAWARKKARTDKVTELVRELRRRSSELEDEFAQILED